MDWVKNENLVQLYNRFQHLGTTINKIEGKKRQYCRKESAKWAKWRRVSVVLYDD